MRFSEHDFMHFTTLARRAEVSAWIQAWELKTKVRREGPRFFVYPLTSGGE